MPQTKPLFDLGQCVATPGALEALEENYTFPIIYLARHQSGDWGCLTADDKAMNDAALTDESRILSAYVLPDGTTKIWVITEAVGDDGKRESTCILLPSEY
jgi:hypothetical protein